MSESAAMKYSEWPERWTARMKHRHAWGPIEFVLGDDESGFAKRGCVTCGVSMFAGYVNK